MLSNLSGKDLVRHYVDLENNFHRGIIGLDELRKGFENIFDPAVELLLKPRTFTKSRSQFIGVESVIDVIVENKHSFSELYTEVEDLVEGPDQVWVRGFVTGRHVAPYVGIPALNTEINIEVFIIFKLLQGRINEIRFSSDTLSLFLQMGKAILEKNEEEEVELYIGTLQNIGLIRKSSWDAGSPSTS